MATSLLEPFLEPGAGLIVGDPLAAVQFAQPLIDLLAEVQLSHDVSDGNVVRQIPDHFEDGFLRRHEIILPLQLRPDKALELLGELKPKE